MQLERMWKGEMTLPKELWDSLRAPEPSWQEDCPQGKAELGLSKPNFAI